MCDHEKLRCTNGVFFCLVCGREVYPMSKKEEEPTAEPETAGTPKKAVKRRTKKGE